MSAAEKAADAGKLSSLARNVALHAGTERAFTGETVNGYPHDNHAKGTVRTVIPAAKAPELESVLRAGRAGSKSA